MRHHLAMLEEPTRSDSGRAPTVRQHHVTQRGEPLHVDIRILEQLAQDVRYAMRAMAANPLFTATAVLSLALGIGANTAIYSFMDAILLRALPVTHPEQLAVAEWHAPRPLGVS